MYKTAAIALIAALGIAAAAPAHADPDVRIGIRVPGLILAAPLVRVPFYYQAYRYGYTRPYWRRRVDREDFDHRDRDWYRRDEPRRWEHRRFEREHH